MYWYLFLLPCFRLDSDVLVLVLVLVLVCCLLFVVCCLLFCIALLCLTITGINLQIAYRQFLSLTLKPVGMELRRRLPGEDHYHYHQVFLWPLVRSRYIHAILVVASRKSPTSYSSHNFYIALQSIVALRVRLIVQAAIFTKWKVEI